MELLILFVIGLLIAICVLPFVALAKANTAKRALDDLAARLSSLESSGRARERIGAAANSRKIRPSNRSSNRSAAQTAY